MNLHKSLATQFLGEIEPQSPSRTRKIEAPVFRLASGITEARVGSQDVSLLPSIRATTPSKFRELETEYAMDRLTLAVCNSEFTAFTLKGKLRWTHRNVHSRTLLEFPTNDTEITELVMKERTNLLAIAKEHGIYIKDLSEENQNFITLSDTLTFSHLCWDSTLATVAAVGSDNRIYLWALNMNAVSASPELISPDSMGTVTCLGFFEQFLVFGTQGQLHLYDFDRCGIVASFSLCGLENESLTAAYACHNCLIVSTKRNSELHVFLCDNVAQVAGSMELHRTQTVRVGLKSDNAVNQLRFSPLPGHSDQIGAFVTSRGSPLLSVFLFDSSSRQFLTVEGFNVGTPILSHSLHSAENCVEICFFCSQSVNLSEYESHLQAVLPRATQELSSIAIEPPVTTADQEEEEEKESEPEQPSEEDATSPDHPLAEAEIEESKPEGISNSLAHPPADTASVEPTESVPPSEVATTNTESQATEEAPQPDEPSPSPPAQPTAVQEHDASPDAEEKETSAPDSPLLSYYMTLRGIAEQPESEPEPEPAQSAVEEPTGAEETQEEEKVGEPSPPLPTPTLPDVEEPSSRASTADDAIDAPADASVDASGDAVDSSTPKKRRQRKKKASEKTETPKKVPPILEVPDEAPPSPQKGQRKKKRGSLASPRAVPSKQTKKTTPPKTEPVAVTPSAPSPLPKPRTTNGERCELTDEQLIELIESDFASHTQTVLKQLQKHQAQREEEMKAFIQKQLAITCKEQIEKALETPYNTKMINTVADKVRKGIRADIQNSLTEPFAAELKRVFSTTLQPTIERSCQKLFNDLEGSFQSTISTHAQSLSTTGNITQLTEAVGNLTNVCNAMVGSIVQLSSLRQTIASGQGNYGAIAMPVMTPEQEIESLLQQGDSPGALDKAIRASNLDLVMHTIQRIGDPATVVNPSTDQMILLCLLQQLGVDLNEDSQTKITWISTAIRYLRVTDPQIVRMSPSVIQGLYQSFERFRASNPNSPLVYDANFLLPFLHSLLFQLQSSGPGKSS